MDKKKIYTFFACGVLMLSASLDAGSCSSNKQDEESHAMKEQRRMAEEQRKSGGARQEKVSGDWGVKVPAAHGCSWNEGFTSSLDYLIMRFYQPNLVLSERIYREPRSSDLNQHVMRGEMVRPNRTWRPGFRVGFGYNTSYDMWDARTEWTYYYNKSITNRANDPIVLIRDGNNNLLNDEEGYIPYHAFPTDYTNNVVNIYNTDAGGNAVIAKYQAINAAFLLNYNMIDGELGRSMYLTKALALRPHIGIRNGWIYQKATVIYSDSLNSVDGFDAGNQIPQNQKVNLNRRFWGIGIRTGMDGEWKIGYGFSILGKVAGSLLSGRSRTSWAQDMSINTYTTSPVGRDINRVQWHRIAYASDRLKQLSPCLENSIGVMWGMCFDNDNKYFGLKANWESTYWWSQAEFMRPAAAYWGGLAQQPALADVFAHDYPEGDGAINLEGVSISAVFEY